MKRLITIILALIMTLFSTPQKGADRPPVTAEKPPQTAVTVTVEVPEESEMAAETAFVGEVSETETAVETEEVISTEPEEDTVECIDEGDQSLAEYKPKIGGQPNPFENDTPTEIDDRTVEDYIGEGEDRPGEGKHF